MSADIGLLPTAAAGVCLFTPDFETVISGLATALGRLATQPSARRPMHCPPVIARETIEDVGYPETFPHLLGRVFTGTSSETPRESDVTLVPAACYCVYPLFMGEILAAPAEVSVEATCFRQEEGAELGRLRSFRMRELVRIDTAEQCLSWRDDGLETAQGWLEAMGLEVKTVVASDPFFGNPGRLLSRLQIERKLKFELTTEVAPGQMQAIASGNCHGDKFGQAFEIVGPDGGTAHTACLAFGYERMALALMHQHGSKLDDWPESVRELLGLEAA